MLKLSVNKWESRCAVVAPKYPMLSHAPVLLKSEGKGSETFGRLWREQVWEPPALAPLFSSWSDGRGLLRPALMVEVIRLLFPYRSTPYLFPLRLCCVVHTPSSLCHLKDGKRRMGPGKDTKRAMSTAGLIVLALDYSFSVYSFTDHGEVLPQRHKDVLRTYQPQWNGYPCPAKLSHPGKPHCETDVVDNCVEGIHTLWFAGRSQAAMPGSWEREWSDIKRSFQGDKLAGIRTGGPT